MLTYSGADRAVGRKWAVIFGTWMSMCVFRGLRDDQIPPTLLGSGDQDNSYSTLSDAQLDGGEWLLREDVYLFGCVGMENGWNYTVG